MDRVEAKWLLTAVAGRVSSSTITSELRELMGEPQLRRACRSRPAGNITLSSSSIWDAQPNGDIRVLGSIDDYGWRTFVPLTDDFLVSPPQHTMGSRP